MAEYLREINAGVLCIINERKKETEEDERSEKRKKIVEVLQQASDFRKIIDFNLVFVC